MDYLGVSLDALLIYCSEKVSEKIKTDLEKNNIKCAEIGYVTDSKEVTMIFDDETENILPRFRESAYTKIKQEVGEETPELINEMERKVEKAASDSLQKRKNIIDYIRNL